MVSREVFFDTSNFHSWGVALMQCQTMFNGPRPQLTHLVLIANEGQKVIMTIGDYSDALDIGEHRY